ncbi:acyltransferase [Arcicella sp. DC2W]|uniref:Acyltransferase n=1 Tax=Arcicella gelida TaxID=2984195 RepID=A0ABU5S7W4_9BACT|nr:acyltransferase [Arcicella sp. DC2W]MEA5404566.1 acyltransferase [Arcicella sp. DC2W]
MRKIKLQCFFILLQLFNFIYWICFPLFIRRFLLLLTGSKIGKDSVVQNVKFFSFGKLNIGNNTIINSGCYLDNRRGITVGNHCVIAHDTKIYTLGHEIDDLKFKTKGKNVDIEDYVIIFSNVLIMPGVSIGKGSVILPGSVVTKDIPTMKVVGGNPAKIIRDRQVLHSDKEPYKYWFSL